jgi:hypothetical protein
MSEPPEDVPGRAAPEPAVADGGLAEQPTDQLPFPRPRQPTERYGPWQPLHPRVVPRCRSRSPYVVTALVLLIVAVGV